MIATEATRIRMITYYIDALTDPLRPRLVRRINNGAATAVAFDIENLSISYDLVDGDKNPANVKMSAADLGGTGACSPDPCSPNQIRKINIMLVGPLQVEAERLGPEPAQSSDHPGELPQPGVRG